MLKKLTTHDIQDVSALFSLADKCAKAAEGRTWHSPVVHAVKGESKPMSGHSPRVAATTTIATKRRRRLVTTNR
jgi:hypothetical protein